MTENEIQNRKVSNSLWLGIFLLPGIFSWFTLRKGYSTRARVISFGYWFLSAALFVSSCNTQKQTRPQQYSTSVNTNTSTTTTTVSETKVENPISITAEKLTFEYKLHEVRGNIAYKDKLLFVTGKIVKITTGFDDKPIIHLDGYNKYNYVVLYGVNEDTASKLNLGDSVNLLARCHGMTLGNVVLRLAEN